MCKISGTSVTVYMDKVLSVFQEQGKRKDRDRERDRERITLGEAILGMKIGLY